MGTVQFYTLKNWSALTETKDQITKLDDQIREGERKARQATQDVAHRAEVKSFVETQRAAMVTGDPFAWVVREISLLAEQEPVHLGGLHPAGKIDVWRREINCLFGLALDGVPITPSHPYDPTNTYVCPVAPRNPSNNTVTAKFSNTPTSFRFFGRRPAFSSKRRISSISR